MDSYSCKKSNNHYIRNIRVDPLTWHSETVILSEVLALKVSCKGKRLGQNIC